MSLNIISGGKDRRIKSEINNTGKPATFSYRKPAKKIPAK
jgi:hypothetical protein